MATIKLKETKVIYREEYGDSSYQEQSEDGQRGGQLEGERERGCMLLSDFCTVENASLLNRIKVLVGEVTTL